MKIILILSCFLLGQNLSLLAKEIKEPSFLAKRQWGVVFIEPSKADSKGNFDIYLLLNNKKTNPKTGDKVWVQALGDESEHVYGRVRSIKNQVAIISITNYPKHLQKRKWKEKRGFKAFVATPTTKAYAHGFCRYSDLPSHKGVSCNTLQYVISDETGKSQLLHFSYDLKGQIDKETGTFISDYTGTLTFVRKKEKWVLLSKTIPL